MLGEKRKRKRTGHGLEGADADEKMTVAVSAPKYTQRHRLLLLRRWK